MAKVSSADVPETTSVRPSPDTFTISVVRLDTMTPAKVGGAGSLSSGDGPADVSSSLVR